MNFDINTLSTLMKMMGSMKPTQSDERSRDPREYAETDNRSGQSSASVFAMQNGLGQKVEFGSEPRKSEPQKNVNPMQSILEMMTGTKSSDGGSDMMSSLLPMFLNMMGGRNQASAASVKPQQPSEQNNTKTEPAANENNKNAADAQKERNTKTQPLKKDKFEPIAFAGYALISALNRLYIAKCV